MKCRVLILLIVGVSFVISSCASYKDELSGEPYKGYVYKRNDFLIPEYTVDTKNKAPEDLKLALNRFKRRRSIIEDYYKKMGRIENQFKSLIINYPLELFSLISIAARWPFIIVSDYRYDHNPKYKEKIDKRDEELDRKEEKIRKDLENKLNKFIERDLAKENYSYNLEEVNTK
ncbi:MAG: hypothetical protein Q8O13_03090 [Candidatus Omnitrophota bacterium]|nr:hypothetical protein [Candidatus Omnitrophota bacterium]